MEYLTKTDFDSSILSNIVHITTISITFKTGTNLFIDEIKKVYPNDKKPFYNSTSILIPIDKNSTRTIHCKLFKNGSVQCAGFKTLQDINYAISYVIDKLSEVRENKLIEKNIVVSNVKIILINSNFSIPFSIRRDVFFKLLLEDGIVCFFDSCKHSALQIHFLADDKKKPIKIFIFQSGSVNVFGSKHHNHIFNAYNFLKELVDKHAEAIKVVNLESRRNIFY
jgi:TATA-box binding protein (TBP) (component of TFIID and TFIIIB)